MRMLVQLAFARRCWLAECMNLEIVVHFAIE